MPHRHGSFIEFTEDAALSLNPFPWSRLSTTWNMEALLPLAQMCVPCAEKSPGRSFQYPTLGAATGTGLKAMAAP